MGEIPVVILEGAVTEISIRVRTRRIRDGGGRVQEG